MTRRERLLATLAGRLWRVVGSEYASEPYRPPQSCRKFLCNYTRPQALEEGPDVNGSRFVLMPSVCPYEREITKRTMTNHEAMVRFVNA